MTKTLCYCLSGHSESRPINSQDDYVKITQVFLPRVRGLSVNILAVACVLGIWVGIFQLALGAMPWLNVFVTSSRICHPRV